MLTRMWILAFGLVLLGTPAEAVSCRADSCQKKERGDRDASGKELLPGLPVRDELEPSLRKRGEPPSGDEIDWRGREWRKRIATLRAISTQ